MIDNVFIFNRELDINEIQQRTNCPLIGDESGLVGYWNFELPSQAYSNALGGVNVSLDASGPNCQQQIGGFMCSGNGNNGVINGATYTTNVPSQSCNLTNVSGCDSVAVLNLTINQSDTSYTNITSCDSIVWNGMTYNQSGVYYSNTNTSNNFSMSFDGTGYISLSADQLPNTSERTISLWFYSDQIGNNNYGENLLDYGGLSCGQSFQMCINNACNSSNTFSLEVQGHCGINTLQSDGTIQLNGNWHNWVVTTSSDGTFFYLDGILVKYDSTLFINNTYTTGRDFIIGYPLSDNGLGIGSIGCFEGWIGYIDDVHIWDVALSQSEINNYMNCPPLGTETGLVGYWNFEEGSGNIVYDQTNNGIDGIINGATYDTNVPFQACNLTNINGCDSVAVLNLTINQSDTSYTNITACDSFVWNGITYSQSGVYYYNGNNNLNISGFTYLDQFNGSYYYLSNSATNWQNANQNCINSGGNLLSISNVTENTFVTNLMSSSNPAIQDWYIGFNQNLNSIHYSDPIATCNNNAWSAPWAGWQWSNGENVNYVNWYNGSVCHEPNNNGNNEHVEEVVVIQFLIKQIMEIME